MYIHTETTHYINQSIQHNTLKMSDEEQMNMIEILSEELGQKEVRLMANEVEIEHLRKERMLFVEQIFIHENILFNGWNTRYDFRHQNDFERYRGESDIEKFIEQVNKHAINFQMKLRCFEMCEEVNSEYELVDMELLLNIIEEGAMGWDEDEGFDETIIRHQIIEDIELLDRQDLEGQFINEDSTIYYFCQNTIDGKTEYQFLVDNFR